MFRSPTLALAATAALALAACGGSASRPASRPTPPRLDRARRGLQLTAEQVPAEARDQGLRASYSNAATAVKDKQVVGLFVMKNADVADDVADLVRGSAPKSARLIRHGEVMVVYAPAGSDRGAEVSAPSRACDDEAPSDPVSGGGDRRPRRIVLRRLGAPRPSRPSPRRSRSARATRPFMLAHAIGVQIYACTATADGPKWQFVAPRAVLYGNHFQFLGTHFAGPTWQTKEAAAR